MTDSLQRQLETLNRMAEDRSSLPRTYRPIFMRQIAWRIRRTNQLIKRYEGL